MRDKNKVSRYITSRYITPYERKWYWDEYVMHTIIMKLYFYILIDSLYGIYIFNLNEFVMLISNLQKKYRRNEEHDDLFR